MKSKSVIDLVLGRVNEDVNTALENPPEDRVPTPDSRQSRRDYDEETGSASHAGVEDVPSETVVSELLNAWHNGQRNEVAAQLLFTPVSYADFVKLCFALGQTEAVQLGFSLDELAESEGMVTNEPSQNKLLAPPKAVQGPSKVPAGPGGQPMGEEPEDAAQAADRALPPPPTAGEEPDEPHEP